MIKQTVKRILFVDDEKDLAEMAKRKLERFGYQVDVAHNGQEGIDVINKEDFDLVVTDVVMPVMDGFTFLKKLQKNKETSNIPVMVLTARANMEDSFRALGVHDFLVKPFDGQKLIEKIELIMSRSMGIKQNMCVLIAGSVSDKSKEMVELFNQHGCEAENIAEPMDIIKIATQRRPDFILIDLLLQPCKSYELIKAIKSFTQLAESKILTYMDFDPLESGNFRVIEEIKTLKSQCQVAGANKFISVYKKSKASRY